MKKQRLWKQRTLAYVLSATMLLTSVALPVSAAETEEDGIITEMTVEMEESTQDLTDDIQDLMEETAETQMQTESDSVESEETKTVQMQTESEESQTTESAQADMEDTNNSTNKATGNILDSGVINDVSWEIDKDGTLSVTGSGDYYLSDGLGSNMPWDAPWYAHREEITSAKVSVTGMTDISYMFQDCAKLEQVDFSGFTSDNLRGASAVFEGCESLTELNLSTLQTDKVINMNAMFRNCANLKSLNMSGFKTDGVKDMSFMFAGCCHLSFLDLSEFCTENVTDMSYMFSDCSSLTVLNLNGFQTENITDMQAMFAGCSALTQLNLDSFDVKNVTNMDRMFEDCVKLSDVDLSHFVTQSVTSLYGMFSGCSSLTQLKLNRFYTENVSNMESMFCNCASLLELDLSSFDTSSVQNMSQMFAGCRNLSKLTIDSFQTENVTTMERMFLECASITELDLSSFQTGNVTTMEMMFNDCKSLERLNVNSFNTRSVKTVMEMFSGCTSLTELDLSSFDLSSLTDEMSVFGSCGALKKIYAPRRLSVSIPLMIFEDLEAEQDNHWYQGKDVVTELPKNLDVSVLLTRGQETAVTEAYITAVKKKTVYVCGETLELDDLTVQYYGTDASVTPVTNYTTNKDEIDMSTEGIKELRVTYQIGDKELTTVVKLTVQAAAEGNIAEGISGNITWTIDQTGKLMITGSSDYERNNGQTPWYDYRARIKTAVVQAAGMTDASLMFADCVNLTDVDLSGFDAKTVTDMSGMFRDCGKLTEINFVNFDTTNVVDLSSMFDGCVSLVRLDLSSFNTKNVTDLAFLVSGCCSLQEIDLSSFDTRKVTDISGMFANCKSLSFLDLSSFDLSGLEQVNDAKWVQPFLGCDSLDHLRTPINCSVAVTLPGSEDGIMWYPSIDVTLWELPNIKTSVDLFKEEFPTVELTITYDLQGHGTPIDAVTADYGKKLTAPEAPTEEGYTFGGWYREKECIRVWNFDTDTVTDDMTLYAKWTKNNNVGTDIDDSAYTQDERIDFGTIGGSIANIKSKIYDGSPYEPTVKVTVTEAGKKKTLTEGTDYRVLYDKNTDAGTQGTVTVKGNGRYKGALTATLTINPKSIKKLKFTAGNMTVGDGQKPLVYVYDGGKLLTEGTDYQLSYDKNLTTQPAKAVPITVNGLGNYTGSATVKLEVHTKDISKNILPEHVTLNTEKVPYTGKAVKTVTPTVKIGTVTLQLNKDYKVQYQNNKNAGTAFVIVKGKGDYTGTVIKPFEITPVTSPLSIKAISDKTYNGKLQKPAVSVTAGEKKLSKKDYTVSYTKNLHAGIRTAQVTVIGRGNYAGTQQTAVFNIQPQKITKASVKGEQGSLTLIYNKNVLKEGTDYTLQYGETVKDKIVVTITGMGDFSGIMTKKVKARNDGGSEDKEPEKPDEKESETSSEEDKKPDKPTDDENERAIAKKLQTVYQELGLNSLSKFDKIGTIYDYVTNNVTYDSKGESAMRYTVYGALIEGKAVCQGYALLLERMFEDNGIASQYIAGIGLSCAGGPERHAWNIVEYDGLYYNLDATWDCTNGKTRKWFLKSQADFEDHVRDTQYETEEFLKKYPMAKYSYGEDGPLPKYENLDYTFDVVGGGTVSTSTAADKKATVLIFGRTTCGNTMTFLKSLKEKEFAKREDIRFIFADVDKDDTEEMVAAFRKEYGTQGMYFCYAGTQVWTNIAAFQYYNKIPYEQGNSFILPLVVVIDSENTVRFIRSYPVSTTSVEQCFERLEQ